MCTVNVDLELQKKHNAVFHRYNTRAVDKKTKQDKIYIMYIIIEYLANFIYM